MLKLLVVDDEMVILQGLVKIIRTGNTPFMHIEYATDAVEAISMLSYFTPDLIITDINMPEKNGLQLIQEVKERQLCNRFIILTGYDEFAYARQAIQYQVIDYCLKPIDKQEILTLLRKVAKEIMEEKGAIDNRVHAQPPQSEYCLHVTRIVDYIKQNYDQDLSLDRFSELTDLHPAYISQLFKKETGVTFIQYLHDYRIAKAKELLLANTTLPVQLVGHQVGYENPQHFMKVFKKIAGCTPRSYRES